MTIDEQELEVKFYLTNQRNLINKLRAVGASMMQSRTHEYNLRFDTPDQQLKRSGQVLRLRQDARATVTYKGPGQVQDEVSARQEIEFQVSDFAAARRFLEALGYEVALIYEKYRTVYQLDGADVTVDEMPYGTFSEVEGPNGERIRAVAEKLGLRWEARAVESYMMLFARVKTVHGLTFRDLTFSNFNGIKISAEDLGVAPADG
jgi:adenylate cyclase class 2